MPVLNDAARAACVRRVDVVEARLQRRAERAALVRRQTVRVQERRQRDLIERARTTIRELRRQHAVAFEHEADEIAGIVRSDAPVTGC